MVIGEAWSSTSNLPVFIEAILVINKIDDEVYLKVDGLLLNDLDTQILRPDEIQLENFQMQISLNGCHD